MSNVVIFGTGQWAELAFFYLTHDSEHSVVGFTVDREYLGASNFQNLPVVAFDEVSGHFPPDTVKMFIPMSFKNMNHVRAKKYYDAKHGGYSLISYVSSKATTWPGFSCGDNCFIFEDNTIQPFVTIGNNVIIWSGNHVGHHSTIKDHVMITSHVVVSGCCTIEEYSFLGANAVIRDETVVARDTLIGMGANVQKDTKEFQVYRATPTAPARVRSDELFSISHKSRS
jgi:sugar O-acyltransferase (sialic acid O-acetyltransferase NeuD family)